MNPCGLFISAGLPPAGGFPEAERMLGEALKGVAAELRLIGVADLATFVRLAHMPNLQDLVRSATELYFKSGTLELAETGELEMGWSSPPLITFPMIFRHEGLFVYFRLRLAALTASVEVETACMEDGGLADRFHQALRTALDKALLKNLTPV